MSMDSLLPELLELIFKDLDELDHISLVCKNFLTPSSNLKHRLTITIFDLNVLSNLFKRFTKINCINIDCKLTEHDFNSLMSLIARSGLDLHELNFSRLQPFGIRIGLEGFRELGSRMKNFKILRFGTNFNLNNTDLDVIGRSIQQLEELDIKARDEGNLCRYKYSTVTDAAIEGIASRLTRLSKIDTRGNMFMTDSSLIALSLNCQLLTKIVVGNLRVTEHGIGCALRNCQNLTSLWIDCIQALPKNGDVFTFNNSISRASKSLCELGFEDMIFNDEHLLSIAQAHLPLKRLALFSRLMPGITYSGLSFLLHECQSINELELGNAYFLTDQMMDDLSTYLCSLARIKIVHGPKLTYQAFVILTRKFPLLEDIALVNVGPLDDSQEENYFMHSQQENNIVNYNIRTVSFNGMICTDESIRLCGVLCPNLKHLNLRCCSPLTEEGIGEILKSCPDLTHLNLEGPCKGRRILGTGSEVSELNLEVLEASITQVDDGGLALIGTRCPRLLQLNLRQSYSVSEKGVEDVVERCRNLREIDLTNCSRVSSAVVPRIISARPSLRKIIAGHIDSNEELSNLCLRHGCMFN